MITVGKYPIPLPAGVSIPSWAYYDFTTSGVFNAVVASQQISFESSAISGPTSNPVPSPSPTITYVISPTPTEAEITGAASTPKSVKTQSKSSSNTGAIIGGVVGGVLGIGLITLIAFVLTRKRKSEDPATKYPEAHHKPPMTAPFNLAPTTGQVPPYRFNAQDQPVPAPEYKSYDPR
ncbi:transmembrane protein, putative, partial [Rhizoctonia solani AG-3 Rhs1AP]